MSFQIGVMSDSFLCDSVEAGIKKAAEVGASGVQIYAVSGKMSPENITDETLKSIKACLEKNGLVAAALCGDLGGHGFVHEEDNVWKIEKSKRIIDLALSLDSNVVTTHIGCIPEDKNSKTYAVMQKACQELAEYAYNAGAFFAIETGPEPAVRLKEFLDTLTVKGVGVNYDPANLAMVTGDDPVQGVYTLKDYIVHTHAKDGIQIMKSDPLEVYGFFAEGGIGDLNLDRYFKEVPLGQGDVNFDAYLKALHEIGYNGFLTIERECGDNPFEDIQMAVGFLQSKIWNLISNLESDFKFVSN